MDPITVNNFFILSKMLIGWYIKYDRKINLLFKIEISHHFLIELFHIYKFIKQICNVQK